MILNFKYVNFKLSIFLTFIKEMIYILVNYDEKINAENHEQLESDNRPLAKVLKSFIDNEFQMIEFKVKEVLKDSSDLKEFFENYNNLNPFNVLFIINDLNSNETKQLNEFLNLFVSDNKYIKEDNKEYFISSENIFMNCIIHDHGKFSSYCNNPLESLNEQNSDKYSLIAMNSKRTQYTTRLSHGVIKCLSSPLDIIKPGCVVKNFSKCPSCGKTLNNDSKNHFMFNTYLDIKHYYRDLTNQQIYRDFHPMTIEECINMIELCSNKFDEDDFE